MAIFGTRDMFRGGVSAAVPVPAIEGSALVTVPGTVGDDGVLRLPGEDGYAPPPVAMAGVGFTASASFSPTASLYGALDVMGASGEFAFTLADGTPIPEGSVIRILTSIMKVDFGQLTGTEGAYLLQCYSVTQPSAQADNDAWTLVSGDLPSYRGSIPLGTPVDQGAALYVKSPNINLDIKLTTSSLWARLLTVPSFTPTAVARQVLLYGIVL